MKTNQLNKIKDEPKIKEINYGLGFCVAENGENLYIEINKNLNKYPKLKKEVVKHEMLHWNAKGWWDDFKIDFFDIFNLKKQKDFFIFQLKNPKALLSNSPVFFENGKIIPNWFMIWFFIILSILIITFINLV